jgi:hypothetical protein
MGPHDQPVSLELPVPPNTAWFGLEVRTGAGVWERCENPQWGPRSKWWKLIDAKPPEIAAEFGPGVYRAMWRDNDKRIGRGTSEPFEVVPAPGDEPELEPAPSSPEDVGYAPEHRERPQPKPPAPAPSNGSRGDFRLPPANVMDNPLAQMVYLHGLVQADTMRREQLLIQTMTMLMGASQQQSAAQLQAAEDRASQHTADQQRFYEAMAAAKHQTPNGEVRKLAEAMQAGLNQLAARIEEIDSDEDDPTVRLEEALAQLEENPTKMGVVFEGINQAMQSFGPLFEMWKKAQQEGGQQRQPGNPFYPTGQAQAQPTSPAPPAAEPEEFDGPPEQ